MFTKKTIMQKTKQFGGLTLLSRIFGLVREVFLARFLGATLFSDAFITAYKIPNSLRKIFAEGALSAAFIPTFSALMQQGKKDEVSRLITLSFIIIEGFLVALCVLAFFKANWVMRIFAPGWYPDKEIPQLLSTGLGFLDAPINNIASLWADWGQPLPQVAYAISYFKILIAFIVFLSSSALLAGALQSVGHFLVTAFSPVLLNIVFIVGILSCLKFGLSIKVLCWFILFGGLLQFLLHVFVYFCYRFSFDGIDKQTWKTFKHVMGKFFPVLLSMSVMEIFFIVDSSIATFLPAGSITLLYYANRFMQIPFGVFIVPFATVLLPYFSRVRIYAPKRLGVYLLESAKLMFWITMPIMLAMMYLSQKIFYTIFLSKKFTAANVEQASFILISFLFALFFFAMNRILLNIYYAFHETRIPLLVSLCATFGNFMLSYFVFMPMFGVYGIAFATSISAALQTALFLFFVPFYFNFPVYLKRFIEFVMRYSIHLAQISILFVVAYEICSKIISLLPVFWANLLLNTAVFWLWVGPLIVLMFYLLNIMRKRTGLRLYFLD